MEFVRLGVELIELLALQRCDLQGCQCYISELQQPTYEMKMHHLLVVQWSRDNHYWMIVDAILHSTFSMGSPDCTFWQILR
jgi:hypothetical protein